MILHYRLNEKTIRVPNPSVDQVLTALRSMNGDTLSEVSLLLDDTQGLGLEITGGLERRYLCVIMQPDGAQTLLCPAGKRLNHEGDVGFTKGGNADFPVEYAILLEDVLAVATEYLSSQSAHSGYNWE